MKKLWCCGAWRELVQTKASCERSCDSRPNRVDANRVYGATTKLSQTLDAGSAGGDGDPLSTLRMQLQVFYEGLGSRIPYVDEQRLGQGLHERIWGALHSCLPVYISVERRKLGFTNSSEKYRLPFSYLQASLRSQFPGTLSNAIFSATKQCTSKVTNPLQFGLHGSVNNWQHGGHHSCSVQG